MDDETNISAAVSTLVTTVLRGADRLVVDSVGGPTKLLLVRVADNVIVGGGGAMAVRACRVAVGVLYTPLPVLSVLLLLLFVAGVVVVVLLLDPSLDVRVAAAHESNLCGDDDDDDDDDEVISLVVFSGVGGSMP